MPTSFQPDRRPHLPRKHAQRGPHDPVIGHVACTEADVDGFAGGLEVRCAGEEAAELHLVRGASEDSLCPYRQRWPLPVGKLEIGAGESGYVL
jgi:hypothetical protein